MNTNHDYHVTLPQAGVQFNLVSSSNEEAAVNIAGRQYRIVTSEENAGAIRELFKNLALTEFKSILLKDMSR
jgi:hypothetical protein